MKDSYGKSGFAIFLVLALAIVSMTTLTIVVKPQQVIAQSPMNMMGMMEMMGGSDNMTDSGMMMGDGNMSMPFNRGVAIMSMMCTTPNQLLGSLTGKFGGGGMNSGDGNMTQQMMMEMMSQQMNMSGGRGMGMHNMSESKMQQAMNFQVCIPTTGEEMMQHMQDMMGNAQNSTGGTMNGMMMQ